jgi:dTMP kinase
MRQRSKGFFITIEGDEGLGKSTQEKLLTEWLEQSGHDVIRTFEPGGTPVGQVLRGLLLNKEHKLGKATELFLFQADRAEHYRRVLKPAIRAGKIVVCDRFWDTTMAYQGAGRGWSRALLLGLHHATTGFLVPDLTLVLCGTPHAAKAMDPNDTFESENPGFRARIAAEFERLAAQGGRYVRIDANRSVRDVRNEIYLVVTERLQLQAPTQP